MTSPVATALLILSAGPSGLNYGGAHGWACSAPVDVDGFRGSILRQYTAKGDELPYIMEVKEPGSPSFPHSITWTVDPDPAGPPPRRKPGFLAGRKEADAFRTGPDYVHISFTWHTRVEGPVWAHYWGDGAYVGADLLQTARAARRFRDRQGLSGGISGGISNRALLTALAEARTWQVVAIDSTGKRLFTESFQVPGWRSAEAEFRRARAQIDRIEAEFRKHHEPREVDGASCTDQEDPSASI